MNKINWSKKLSSRKFWAALIGFVTSVLFAFNYAETDVTKITAIISATGTLVAYIFAEGYIDGKREDNQNW